MECNRNAVCLISTTWFSMYGSCASCASPSPILTLIRTASPKFASLGRRALSSFFL